MNKTDELDEFINNPINKPSIVSSISSYYRIKRKDIFEHFSYYVIDIKFYGIEDSDMYLFLTSYNYIENLFDWTSYRDWTRTRWMVEFIFSNDLIGKEWDEIVLLYKLTGEQD